mmetsp:Transcript_17235/g.42266  ORF Transcript_17235/g.42266 Transcript_17235/m.42266 type:complete len:115 (+) Transcript_17235:358-702(+)|eukprot:CAMPEP_0114516780 /NCGR_PEP_ID=MMETSP0109-20121206/17520_1 /TAXON_ID=29199 /ORGANISM="Chlorarachnion reptans, Strain CCCM449" /LENGTH=114 /DNA_ID=CAMNT_0001697211 /DNA_START=270 /DNA_END=614 /DNA_ORIENTATION=-
MTGGSTRPTSDMQKLPQKATKKAKSGTRIATIPVLRRQERRMTTLDTLVEKVGPPSTCSQCCPRVANSIASNAGQSFTGIENKIASEWNTFVTATRFPDMFSKIKPLEVSPNER